jgi:putative PIN family toxin of toxin-antitoxin system
MLPLRLVVDTNVLVSAALNANGLPRTVLTLALTRPARLYVSAAILEEYNGVLARPELRIRRPIRQQLLQLIRERAHFVAPRHRIQLTADPGDSIFLECAEAARADYLITGNPRHFPKLWRQTKVITAREFMEMAAPHLLG